MQWNIKLHFRLPSFHYSKIVKVNRHWYRQMDRQAHQNEAECFHSTRLYCVQNRTDGIIHRQSLFCKLRFTLITVQYLTPADPGAGHSVTVTQPCSSSALQLGGGTELVAAVSALRILTLHKHCSFQSSVQHSQRKL